MKKRLLLIAVAFSVSFVLMGILSLFSIQRLNMYINYSDLMDHSGFVMEKIYDAEKGIRDIDRSERGYMITKDTMYIRFLNNSVDSLRHSIAALRNLTKDNADLQKNITSLNAAVALRVNAARENIHYTDTAAESSPSHFYYDSRQLMLNCSNILHTIHQSESELKATRYKEEYFYEQLTTSSIRWLLIIFCIVTLFLFIILIKELRGRMHFQDELQAKVIDLRRSHSELQEIAYVASHDLQEPLRKIQVFSNMLLYVRSAKNENNYQENLERINNAAMRMQSLIKDLMSLTSLTKIDEARTNIDLNRTLQFIVMDMEQKIREKDAMVEIKLLPPVNGYEQQLKILFNQILDNSLKFSRNGIKTIITVSHDVINGHELESINPNLLNKKFNRITISDNGIGFDQQFITKMFGIFQQLHQQEAGFEGKGIGLALCLRIMANHEGYITAQGEPDMGAKFKLYFPVEN